MRLRLVLLSVVTLLLVVFGNPTHISSDRAGVSFTLSTIYPSCLNLPLNDECRIHIEERLFTLETLQLQAEKDQEQAESLQVKAEAEERFADALYWHGIAQEKRLVAQTALTEQQNLRMQAAAWDKIKVALPSPQPPPLLEYFQRRWVKWGLTTIAVITTGSICFFARKRLKKLCSRFQDAIKRSAEEQKAIIKEAAHDAENDDRKDYKPYRAMFSLSFLRRLSRKIKYLKWQKHANKIRYAIKIILILERLLNLIGYSIWNSLQDVFSDPTITEKDRSDTDDFDDDQCSQ